MVSEEYGLIDDSDKLLVLAAIPIGGGTYFMTEPGARLVLGYLCHISKDDCLLLCLDKEEVAEALVHGYIPSAKGAGIVP